MGLDPMADGAHLQVDALDTTESLLRALFEMAFGQLLFNAPFYHYC